MKLFAALFLTLSTLTALTGRLEAQSWIPVEGSLAQAGVLGYTDFQGQGAGLDETSAEAIWDLAWSRLSIHATRVAAAGAYRPGSERLPWGLKDWTAALALSGEWGQSEVGWKGGTWSARLALSLPALGPWNARIAAERTALPRLSWPWPTPWKPVAWHPIWEQGEAGLRYSQGNWTGETSLAVLRTVREGPADPAAQNVDLEVPWLAGGLVRGEWSWGGGRGEAAAAGFRGQVKLFNPQPPEALTLPAYDLQGVGAWIGMRVSPGISAHFGGGRVTVGANEGSFTGDLAAPLGSLLLGDYRAGNSALTVDFWAAVVGWKLRVQVGEIGLDVLAAGPIDLRGGLALAKRSDVWDFSTFPPVVTPTWPVLWQFDVKELPDLLLRLGARAGLGLWGGFSASLDIAQWIPLRFPETAGASAPPASSAEPGTRVYGGFEMKVRLTWNGTKPSEPRAEVF